MFFRLLLAVLVCFVVIGSQGCHTITKTGRGAKEGFKEGFKEDVKALKAKKDVIHKTDQWIQENLW